MKCAAVAEKTNTAGEGREKKRTDFGEIEAGQSNEIQNVETKMSDEQALWIFKSGMKKIDLS